MRRPALTRDWAIVGCAVLQLIGTVLFAMGYFSVDDKLLSDVERMDQRLSLSVDTLAEIKKIESSCEEDVKQPLFEKMVFVVIDALRADFIPSIKSSPHLGLPKSTMPFVENLIKTSRANAVIAEANTPTVTMPRIKALLSGTIPSFMDLILNLNAAKFGDDNLLEQAHRKGKRIVFYGDDTWLEMFPASYFVRSNGTSSFFATDYVQVDTNVTENVIPELRKLDDWDFMILHYLGVDHIGHSHGGARSHLMPSKLIEMDNVLKKIYEALAPQRYLIMVAGDHGELN